MTAIKEFATRVPIRSTIGTIVRIATKEALRGHHGFYNGAPLKL